jgi:hypothetical protein
LRLQTQDLTINHAANRLLDIEVNVSSCGSACQAMIDVLTGEQLGK